MFKIITIIVIITLSFFSIANESVDYKDKLIKLAEMDQKIRIGDVNWESVEKIDKENLRQLKKLIKKHGFPTIKKVGREAHLAAFLIAQHSVSDLGFMHYYLDETHKRIGRGSVVDQTYAYLLDRTNQIAGKKQVYGTQGECIDGNYNISPVVDAVHLASLRRKVGLLPLDEFSKQVCDPEDG